MGEPIKQHWILEAWTVDGRQRFFIIATREMAELFRKDLEQVKGEVAWKYPATWHLIMNPKIPWKEITLQDFPTPYQFQKMENEQRKAGPIESE